MTPQEADPQDDPKGAAIHEVYEAVYRLFELLPTFDAHWFSTVAIINAERHAKSKLARL